MKPAPFEYHRPTTVAEATGLLAELGEDAKVLAGGQSLIPMLALRLTSFAHLIDVGAIPELKGIDQRDGALWIGAGTTETAVGASAEVSAHAPLLTRATPHIGHFQIRNRGTIGGSIAHADPAAEYPAVALALDATMEVASTTGTRAIAAADFFDGLWTTTMEPEEVLTGTTWPKWGPRSGFAVEEMARRLGDFAITGAAVGVELDEGGGDRINKAAIALIGMGPNPIRAAIAEVEATGPTVAEIDVDEIGHAATADLESVPSDLHGSADYRRKVGAVMVARALTAAMEEARHG